jgi:DNA-binding MarR family transcriptional regulator
MGTTRGGINNLADRPVAHGLVLRRSGLEDGRAVVLGLSGTGRAATMELAGFADENDREFSGAMPEADRARLCRSMENLARQNGIGASPVD